jgi:hypothetical protein
MFLIHLLCAPVFMFIISLRERFSVRIRTFSPCYFSFSKSSLFSLIWFLF